jgi:glycosyltransferase involved in cell wall biosynthesis
MAHYYPKISIITPSYNQAEFIEKAIISVIDQHYPNYEHIIFDNCSTDSTTDVLSKYPHLIWTSERDNGQSDALNKGFKKANGEIIGWLNADDLYLPGCFLTVVKGFKEHPESSVVYGDYRWINEKGELMKFRREIDFDLFIFKYLHFTYVPSAASFFKERVFKDGNFLNTAYELSMDYEFFLRIALKGYRFTHLKSILADFRWHPQSKSTLFSSKQFLEREKVLLLHDQLLQGIYRPIQPAIRTVFLGAARIKRLILKIISHCG